MSLRSLLVVGALLLCAAPSWAQDLTGTWRLTGREDQVRQVEVELEVTPAGDAWRVRRLVRDADGRERALTGTARRRGSLFIVELPLEAGLETRLAVGRTGVAVLGAYRVEGDRLQGLLHSRDRALGWNVTSERGARTAGGARPGFAPAGRLPFKRVVLCLDGAAWRVLDHLKRQGRFARFAPPARMISCFPSLSSIAWNRLLGLPPEPGYQAMYYANSLGETMGVTARKMQGSRFQTRMHHRHTGLVGHGLAYVAPFLMGRSQLRHLVRELEHHVGSRTAFVYAYQTDPIAHMNGREDLERALVDLDQELEALLARFRAKHGEELEVVILSDHGHTLVKGDLVKLEEHLEARGWTVEDEVRGPDQCAFQSAGILSSIALHCEASRAEALARACVSLAGVDVVTWAIDPATHAVLSPAGEGRFTWDEASDRYGWTVVAGQDPLGYGAVFDRLRPQGKLDAQGRAASRDLFEATADHAYPDAAHRIRVGHGSLVWSPAQVIVSLRPGFENGKGIVKATAALRGRSGTHGGLDQVNSAGAFMTNFLPSPGAIRPEDVGRLVDLSDYLANDPPLELTVDARAPSDGELTLEVLDRAATPTTTYEVALRRKRLLLPDAKVWSATLDGARLRREAGSTVLPLAGAFAKLEQGKTYRLDVEIVRRDAAGRVTAREERRMTFEHRGTYQIAD